MRIARRRKKREHLPENGERRRARGLEDILTQRLKDKVIIVAGAGGIGDGLARYYAREGASLVIGDIDADGVKQLARDIDPSGKRVLGTALDGTDAKSIAAMVALATSTFGKLHGMHVNFANFADAQYNCGVGELPIEVYDQVMEINTRGYVLCTQKALPALIESGCGSIVYTSSIDSYTGQPVRVAYGMSKAALHSLMRHVARAYGPQGVRANVIAPGLIVHERMAPRLDPNLAKSAKARNAYKARFGTAEDIAATGALLLSDEGGYITGQIICVDGGATMRP
jgi:NAD(P)-dependent dehydrogenase (short-subunit alcohol dehydrogenase family)